jgi:hypothetical protein
VPLPVPDPLPELVPLPVPEPVPLPVPLPVPEPVPLLDPEPVPEPVPLLEPLPDPSPPEPEQVQLHEPEVEPLPLMVPEPESQQEQHSPPLPEEEPEEEPDMQQSQEQEPEAVPLAEPEDVPLPEPEEVPEPESPDSPVSARETGARLPVRVIGRIEPGEGSVTATNIGEEESGGAIVGTEGAVVGTSPEGTGADAPRGCAPAEGVDKGERLDGNGRPADSVLVPSARITPPVVLRETAGAIESPRERATGTASGLVETVHVSPFKAERSRAGNDFDRRVTRSLPPPVFMAGCMRERLSIIHHRQDRRGGDGEHQRRR